LKDPAAGCRRCRPAAGCRPARRTKRSGRRSGWPRCRRRWSAAPCSAPLAARARWRRRLRRGVADAVQVEVSQDHHVVVPVVGPVCPVFRIQWGKAVTSGSRSAAFLPYSTCTEAKVNSVPCPAEPGEVRECARTGVPDRPRWAAARSPRPGRTSRVGSHSSICKLSPPVCPAAALTVLVRLPQCLHLHGQRPPCRACRQ
jgi:hypothetical protein